MWRRPMSATASSSPRPCSKAAASPSRPNAPARRRKSRNWRRKSSTGGNGTGVDLKRFGGLQHFLGVAVNLDLAPSSPYHAFAVDQEGRAFDTHVLLAVH